MWIKKAVRGFMAVGMFISIAGQTMAGTQVLHPAIPLYDENGAHVLDSKKPYSARKSCGNNGGSGCHDYDSITRAFHFQQGRDEASDDFGKKRGISSLVSPGYFGGYNCMGGNNQQVLAKKSNAKETDFADMGSAGWLMRCNGCHAGGGWGEKDRKGNRYDETDTAKVTALDGDYYNRGTTADNKATTPDVVSRWDWKKSGVAEADCMMCHADFTRLKKFDPQLNTKGSANALTHFKTLKGTYLAGEGIFRYMGTAILEFLNLNTTSETAKDKSALVFSRYTSMPTGDHSMVHTTVMPMYHLEEGSDGQPVIKWNTAAFDANRKITIPMLRFPDNDNCMNCHMTANSRRGFYGFGDAAYVEYNADGTMKEDYRDDVHKGKTWTENGETRSIENCNSCHSRNYYRPSSGNSDLNADHNFLKGNSDIDVRNDLDYNPGAKSCKYCHNDAANPAIPSGQKDMLSAHREIWKFRGDMAGYPQDSLTRITQTHLDVVSCEACHITGKKYNGTPIKLLYRYRVAEDGSMKIVPYKPSLRYYWMDKNSGRILVNTERNSVFSLKTNSAGQQYGAIIDPVTGKEIGKVSVSNGMHGLAYNDPSDYSNFVALKAAYDSLLSKMGVSNPNAVLVRTEPNEYIISHNTVPAVNALKCGDCHNKKQDGSFSSLISPTGLLGEGNSMTVVALPDRRLVDEGLVVLDLPYMKITNDGKIVENVSDILYSTKLNPSLSVLNAAKARVNMMAGNKLGIDTAISAAKIPAAPVKGFFSSQNLFVFKPNAGDDKVKAVAIMAEADAANQVLLPTYKMEISLADDAVLQASSKAGFGGVDSRVFALKAFDANSQDVTTFNGKGLLVKIPYDGSNANLDQVKVITSSDGSTWTSLAKEEIKTIEPGAAGTEGYILFATSHFSYFAVADSTTAGTGTSESGSSSESKGYCLIATAAYGSYEEPHVQILREFRDRILLTNRLGDAFVKFYYSVSPPAAEWIARHDVVRAVVRVLLLPLFALAYFLLKLSFVQQLVSLYFLLLGGTTVYVLIKRRKMMEVKA